MQPGLNEWFFQGERDHLACREAQKGGRLCHEGDVSSFMIESDVGFYRFSVLSRCPGRSGKSLDFHGRLTNRAFKGGSGSWYTGLHQHVQNQLNQKQQLFGVAVQKTVVSDPAKAFWQNMLQDKP